MTASGPLVEEVMVQLNVSGVRMFEWRCTPADFEALVLGRLYAEDIVVDGRAAAGMRIERTEDFVEINLDVLPQTEPSQRTRSPHVELPDAETFAELFRTLFAGVDARHEEGGMHAAALAHGTRIVVQAEDVGRHNCVDKVIGMALLAGEDVPGCGMLVSSRVSAEIARKAAQAGVAWLASRSIPTTLAIKTARAAGMPIVGRAAGKNAFVYR